MTLPGDLVSPVAGPLLRRGAPILRYRYDCVVVESETREGWWTIAFGGCVESHRAGDLMLDLSDPAGMDLAARWLAAHHGLAVGATAPGWSYDDADEWVLTGTDGWPFRWPATVWSGPFDGVRVVSHLTNPAEALRAACLAAVGRTA